MGKELQIRNSTVDFLVFTRDAGEDGIEVRVQNHDVWLTQKAISQLFDVDRSVVTKHLKNVFEEKELDENSVCAKFAQTADDGKIYQYKFYSLAAIIAVGYRINSERAVQFRTWATKVLETFTKQGYVLDKSRLINGQIFDEDYFEHLIAEIQETSNVTYRIYDFNRKDKNGNTRELHTELSKDAIDYTVEADYRTHYTPKKNEPVELVSCNHFTTSVYDLTENMSMDYSELDSFVIYICMEGSCTVTDNEGNTLTMQAGESVLFPATTQSLEVVPQGNVKFLETYV